MIRNYTLQTFKVDKQSFLTPIIVKIKIYDHIKNKKMIHMHNRNLTEWTHGKIC
jgi:hypothetical protein